MSRPLISSKPLWDIDLWNKLKDGRLPASFWLEVTSRCNNNCRHCYANLCPDDQKAEDGEITLEEIDRVAGEAVAMGCLSCIITGGEPLLRDDFSDIYLSLKKKGLLVSVFTNATLVREEHVDLFKRYPPYNVEVTVYGVTEETYRRVTRGRHFEDFMRGLNLLFEHGVKVKLKTVALRSNVQELPKMASFALERTGQPLPFDPFLHLRIDGDRTRNEEIRAERLPPGEVAALEMYDPNSLRIQEKACNKPAYYRDREKDGHIFRCQAGGWSFLVDSSCRLRPCPSLSLEDCGYDLRTGSLHDAWKEFVPKVKEMQSARSKPQCECRECPLIYLCASCPAHSYIETADLEAKVDYFCEIARERARVRGKDGLSWQHSSEG